MRRPFVIVLVLAAVSAGCLRTFEDPHQLHVTNLDLTAARVLAQDVILILTSLIDNVGGGDSEPVRLVAKAYSDATGFLIANDTREIGIVPGSSTRSYEMFLKVPRSGGVRVDLYLYEGERGARTGSIGARNLEALEPEVLDTGLRIASVDFLVENATDPDRPQIRTDLYVTNEGDAPSEDLRLQVKAREVSTGLVADVVWGTTGVVSPGATIVRSIHASVPGAHNYVFEILTWRGDAIVARTEGNVQLRPTFEKPKDSELVVTTPDLRRFATPTAERSDHLGGTPYGAPTPAPAVPGLGALGIVAAGAAAAILVARRRRS